MSFLGDLVNGASSGAISGTLNGVGSLAVKLREAITGQIAPEKQAEIETHFADLDAQLALAQSKVNEVEAGSSTFFVAGWRPAVGWVCVTGLVYAVFLQPLLAWASLNFEWKIPPIIDTGILLTLLGTLLGVASLRTAEKIKDVAR